MNYNYFDIHSHLTEKRFDAVRDDIAQEMLEKGIGTISIGVDQSESQSAVAFAQKHPNVYASIGQHPVDNKTELFDLNFYQNLLDKNKEKIVCIGECGLDYYWPKKDIEKGTSTIEDFEKEKARQVDLFCQHIDFAAANNLPLMLHVRSYKESDAHRDTFEILDRKQKEHKGKLRANFHFFTEGPDIAKQIVERGYTVSFPGVITFANLDETIRVVPIESMFSETDSPYAAPKPFRGQDATPLMIQQMVKKIAEIKNLDEEVVQIQLIKNTINFFGI